MPNPYADANTTPPAAPPSTYSPAWWSNQANVTRSSTNPANTKLATSFQLQQLGKQGYMGLYPEVFTGGAMNMYGLREVDRLKAQIEDLRQMQLQFSGPEATYIRWFIANRINSLNDQVAYETKGTPAKKTIPPPVPDWLMEYLETSMPAKAAEYMTGFPQATSEGRRKKQFAGGEPLGRELRPLGAQAELTPEQLGLMAGYQAWGKAGSPVKSGDEQGFAGMIAQMSDWQRYMQNYTTLSEKLFPKQTNLRTGWATATQR